MRHAGAFPLPCAGPGSRMVMMCAWGRPMYTLVEEELKERAHLRAPRCPY